MYVMHHTSSFQAVSQSIIAVAVGDVATFFWEHLRMDMRVLGRAMSSAEDEVALYLHQIIASISSRQDVTSMCVFGCIFMQATLTAIRSEGLVHIGLTFMYQSWRFGWLCTTV